MFWVFHVYELVLSLKQYFEVGILFLPYRWVYSELKEFEDYGWAIESLESERAGIWV